jgi:hypothetical protein
MIKVTMTKQLVDWWISDDDAKDCPRQVFLEMLLEDLPALVNNATWEIKINEEVLP